MEREELMPDTLVGDAYRKMLDGIWAYRYAPGSSLSDFTLSKELGISRTPIREALFLLIDDGLVRKKGAGGFEVTDITKEEIEDLYDARSELEVAMLHLTFQKGVPVGLVDTLRYLNGNLLSCLKRGEILPTLDFDTRIHHTLALSSGNRRLLAYFERIEKQVKRIQLFSVIHGHQETMDEHRRIIDALEQNDFRSCERALRINIDNAKRQHQAALENGLGERWWMIATSIQNARH